MDETIGGGVARRSGGQASYPGERHRELAWRGHSSWNLNCCFWTNPSAALDPPTHAKLLDDLSQISSSDHRTAVFVTHNLKEAAKLSHRIAVIVGGMLRQVGTAKQIKSTPADETVAAFLHELPQ